MNDSEGIFWIIMGFLFVFAMGIGGLIILYLKIQEEIKKVGFKIWIIGLIKVFCFALVLSILITMGLVLIDQYMFHVSILHPIPCANITSVTCYE